MSKLNIKTVLIDTIIKEMPSEHKKQKEWAEEHTIILPYSKRKWNGETVIAWLRDDKELCHYTDFLEEDPPDEIIEFKTSDEQEAPKSRKVYREEVPKHPRVYVASIKDNEVKTLYIKYIEEEDIVGFDVSPSGKSLIFISKAEDWANAFKVDEAGACELKCTPLDDASLSNLRFIEENKICCDDDYEDETVEFMIKDNEILEIE